jgi:AraC family transcriptional regulator
MEELTIKNMVCPRCITAVQNILNLEQIAFQKVLLGKVILKDKVSKGKLLSLEQQLNAVGFSILQDKEVRKIESIKGLLRGLLLELEIPSDFNLSQRIKSHLAEDYSRLSHLFSSTEGQTIEKFFIELKVDKIKELLFYEELTISEIAWKLGYSSVQHLSSQFKKQTGMTPSAYKKQRKEAQKGWK